MSETLSALCDDALGRGEASDLWQRLKADPDLSRRWEAYQLIGAAMRAEPHLASNITARVMRGLANEPVVLAPSRKTKRTWPGAVMALAASVAGVAVVGWLALAPSLDDTRLTAHNDSVPLTAPVALAANAPALSASEQDMQEYMLAHHANAPGLSFLGGTQYVRTVSVVGKEK